MDDLDPIARARAIVEALPRGSYVADVYAPNRCEVLCREPDALNEHDLTHIASDVDRPIGNAIALLGGVAPELLDVADAAREMRREQEARDCYGVEEVMLVQRKLDALETALRTHLAGES